MRSSRARAARAPRRPSRAGGGEHAALAGGEDLARVEGPGRDLGAGADRAAVVRRSGAARGVLDDDDAAADRTASRIASRSTGTPPWSTAMTTRVVAASGPPRRSGGSGCRWSASTSANTGPGTDVHRRVGGGDERERRHHDVVARADSGDDQREVQRRRAARHRDRVLAPAWRAANAASNSATRGPCATQPDSITSATAATSSVPSHGCITLMRVMTQAPIGRPRSRRAAAATTRPVGADPPRGRPAATKPRSRAAAVVSASRRVTPLTARSGPCSTSRSESIARSSASARSPQAGLDAAGRRCRRPR